MIDRSQPLVVTPQACPFVALDGDRDQRFDVPDPMHRCYADTIPRARSIGHQLGYCLTPGFSACPIFLDWASRVAADVVGPVPATTITSTTTMNRNGTPVTGTSATGTSSLTGTSPASDPSTTATRTGHGPTTAAGTGATKVGTEATRTQGTATVAAAVAMSSAATPATEPVVRPRASTQAWIAEAAPPPDPFDAPSTRPSRIAIEVGAPDGSPESGEQGITPDPEAAAELAAATARTDLADETSSHAGPGTDADADQGPHSSPPWAKGRPRVPMDAGAPTAFGPQTRPGARSPGTREWEGGRRFEAYAAGKGARRVSRPILITLTAILAAVALLLVFLLPSMFLGGPGATPTPVAAASGAVTPTSPPTATPRAPDATPRKPKPTPRPYKVKPGDTLLRIGRRFGVTVEQLVCANDIQNPNTVRLGMTLVIPLESYRCPKGKKPRT